jgi:hypothetical protein
MPVDIFTKPQSMYIEIGCSINSASPITLPNPQCFIALERGRQPPCWLPDLAHFQMLFRKATFQFDRFH